MQVTEHNDVKVYNISAGKSLPEFFEEARKNNTSLKYNEDYRRRIDLIQDFEFNTACTRIRCSADGECIAAVGCYPPEIRIFETHELGMKVSRGLEHEAVDFLFLSDDWKKFVFLLDDRTVEFHSQYGRHHRMRVPKAARTLSYDSESCVLFVAGSSAEVVRIDLEGGVFHSPVPLRDLEEVHALAANPALPILSCAGDSGLVESYDLRDPTQRLDSLTVCQPQDAAENGQHVTCCAYSDNGMLFAAGTAAGIARVFDIRSSKPLLERDHMNGYPLRSVVFHRRGIDNADLLIGSADSKSVKIWDANLGHIAASVESPSPIHQLTFVPNSGLFFLASDQPRIGVYFVPSIGLAPRWCSFLDSMTEELEENNQKTVFDDYQFVTADQLEQLGGAELVGTKFLQPYMHGYFIDHRLHARLKAATEPFAFEEYRKDRVRKQLDAKRKMRTRVRTPKVAVNQDLHKRMEVTAGEGGEEGASKKRKEAGTKAKHLLTDDRFQVLFTDPDFAIEDKPEGELAAKALADMRKKTSFKRW